jgi:predicted RNA-binding protein with PUA-like domain
MKHEFPLCTAPWVQVRRLARLVSLVELKRHAEGSLQGMALFKYGRLSVQSVERAHWDFVLGLEREEA